MSESIYPHELPGWRTLTRHPRMVQTGQDVDLALDDNRHAIRKIEGRNEPDPKDRYSAAEIARRAQQRSASR